MDDAAFHAVKLAAAQAAMATYGLEKTAWAKDGLKRLFTWKTVAGPKPGFLNHIGYAGRGVAEFGREAVFGSPVNMKAQIMRHARREGSLLKGLGHYVKDFYWQRPTDLPSAGMQAFSLGMPALDLYHAATNDDPDQRKGDLVSSITGLVAAPFTSRLGLLGAQLQEGAQQKARGLVQKDAPPYTPAYNPVTHGKLVLRGARSQADLPFSDLST